MLSPRSDIADDVVPGAALQVAAVLNGGEPAVGDPHHPAESPRFQVVFDLTDERLVVGVAGPAPHPDGDPGAGDSHADHDLGQVGPVVLGVPVRSRRMCTRSFA